MKKKKATRPKKRVPDEMTQTRSRVEDLDNAEGDEGDENGEPNGQAGGEPGGKGSTPNGTGIGVVGDAIGEPTGVVVVKPATSRPQAVPAHMIDGHRVKGDTKIVAPEPVRIAMLNRRQKKLTASVKLCLSASGSPTTVRVIASSGHTEYDARLEAAVKRWRYRPYRVNGQAVPVCTSVQFIYRMR
jgi:protein TonB